MACTVGVSARVGLAITMLVWADRIWAVSPTEQLKPTLSRVMEILKDPRFQGEAQGRKKPELIRYAILARFDFAEMAKRSLGSHWRRYAGRERELLQPFADLVQDSYIGRIELSKPGNIVFDGERMENGFAEVHTTMVSERWENSSVDYRLHFVGREWKVYDVLIERTSLVNRYRSQFHRILTAGSWEDLLREVREERAKAAEAPKWQFDPTISYLLISAGSNLRRAR